MIMIDRIATDLCLEPDYIASIVTRSAFYYRDYYIRKRDGNQRRIAQPSPELKTLQYWTVNNILKKLPVSDSAFAYQKGSSIKKHADFHKNSKFILHTDVFHFFSSITYAHLRPILLRNPDIFKELKIDLTGIDVIYGICFRNNQLCIGAVSSPIISNIIMYDFDLKISEYCAKNHLLYSRYADDIYLSSNSFIDQTHLEYLTEALRELGFQINKSKTFFSSPKNCRRVTGLVIGTDATVTIGSEKRAFIKKLVYQKLVHHIGDGESILGFLAFLKDVEPETYNRIIIKYSRYCKEDIIKELK